MADLERSGIFINYRRKDTAAYAGRLYDSLLQQFDQERIFLDIDTIGAGASFIVAIEQAVRSCGVLLALIGPQWLTATDLEGQRLLENPHDLVRIQLEAARRYGTSVFPILVDEATFPSRAQLPKDLAWLSSTQAFYLRNSTFRDDVDRLIHILKNILVRGRQSTPPYARSSIERTFVVPRNQIFVSYSHQDQYWLDRLLIHMRPLERVGRVELWNDRQIRAGDQWSDEIENAIQSCDAAILLVSADFMASEFIHNNELAPLLESAKGRGVRIVPILVSSSHYEDSDLNRFQAINPPSEPLDMLSKGQQEAYFAKVYRVVKDAL
ncbi:hypothetical protein JOE57_003431 [Microlunatus panaciterrae]|uniref:TIR domain-containing protein n=1 Tax=Microlunatus panaciterrae TaxID=400768 RepID=A0ABS2RNB3_9ACTN|nr:hypothetical protein [Microlunatus panaciterrae]